MELKWSQKFDKCENCTTIRFPHKSRGLCSRCYPLQLRLDHIDKWDLNKIETLKGYPNDMMFHTEDRFQKIKKGFKKQIKDRLFSLTYTEGEFEKIPSGHDLEFKFRRIARLTNADSDLFFKSADTFNREFNDRQRKVLMQFFIQLLESIRWEGVDWWKVWEDKD